MSPAIRHCHLGQEHRDHCFYLTQGHFNTNSPQPLGLTMSLPHAVLAWPSPPPLGPQHPLPAPPAFCSSGNLFTKGFFFEPASSVPSCPGPARPAAPRGGLGAPRPLWGGWGWSWEPRGHPQPPGPAPRGATTARRAGKEPEIPIPIPIAIPVPVPALPRRAPPPPFASRRRPHRRARSAARPPLIGCRGRHSTAAPPVPPVPAKGRAARRLMQWREAAGT